MIKKRIMALALAAAVVGSASATIVYASQQDTIDSTKNIVNVAYDSKNAENNATISDEKAVQMAIKAMEDYMGKSADHFIATEIYRNQFSTNIQDTSKNQIPASVSLRKVRPEVADIIRENQTKVRNNPMIRVSFRPANLDRNKLYSNFVIIDERTGEIVNVTAIDGLDGNSNGQINDGKVRQAALDFFKHIGKTIDVNSIVIKNDNGALSVVDFKFSDGRSGKLEVSLQDYSVVHYEVNYLNLKPVPISGSALTK